MENVNFQCSKECGSAFQFRSVTCRSEKTGEEGNLLPNKQCNDTLKLKDKRTCNLGPCEGLRWVTSDWILVSYIGHKLLHFKKYTDDNKIHKLTRMNKKFSHDFCFQI